MGDRRRRRYSSFSICKSPVVPFLTPSHNTVGNTFASILTADSEQNETYSLAHPLGAKWQWHQLGHMQVCTSLQTDNHASTPPAHHHSVFYRPDALSVAQPAASKHWRHVTEYKRFKYIFQF